MIPNQIIQQSVGPRLLRKILCWPLKRKILNQSKIFDDEREIYFQCKTFEPTDTTWNAIDHNQSVDFRWISQLKKQKQNSRERIFKRIFYCKTCQNIRSKSNTKTDRTFNTKKSNDGNQRWKKHSRENELQMMEDVIDCFCELIHCWINSSNRWTRKDQGQIRFEKHTKQVMDWHDLLDQAHWYDKL